MIGKYCVCFTFEDLYKVISNKGVSLLSVNIGPKILENLTSVI